ncbi:uncharacterized protein [Rutidosis leptorrhynchoides]|uniref:uncharacterized protein n=1 Tax=Rutidosis leptorrhynchoides TaxID=125765 RepID=UPI003A991263
MLEKSKALINSTVASSSKLTTQLNPSKCNNTNSHESTGDSQLHFWPPSTAVVDGLVLKFKAKVGDTESNWEKIILNFKKELDAEEEKQLKAPSSSDVDTIAAAGSGDKSRAIFSVPLSRREMEKDFEDMGERRLPRKPKKRPKSVQNQLDTLFPGLWLTEIHADLYRVSETKKVAIVCPITSELMHLGWIQTYGIKDVNVFTCLAKMKKDMIKKFKTRLREYGEESFVGCAMEEKDERDGSGLDLDVV